MLSADLRVLDPASTAPNPSVFVSYQDGFKRYVIFFDTDTPGQTAVDLSNGYNSTTGNLNYSVLETISPGYHHYELTTSIYGIDFPHRRRPEGTGFD